jgi:putative FmdB family regulatory protein
MPIFEYQCRKCKTIFEHLVVPTTTAKASCPKCKSKGKNLEPVISMFATKDDHVTAQHMNWVKKESRNLKYERMQTEKRLASED